MGTHIVGFLVGTCQGFAIEGYGRHNPSRLSSSVHRVVKQPWQCDNPRKNVSSFEMFRVALTPNLLCDS